MSKVPVYFMPGLAASTAIFERIKLPENDFEVVFLAWEIPFEKESLGEYAQRMIKKIKHQNPVLIGVSFGGILVQEMANYIKVRKTIIISSVKCNLEYPKRMILAKKTKAYKLIPLSLVENIESLARFSFGKKINQRLKLYEKFISVRNKRYLDWAVEQIFLWNRTIADKNVIHIHGDLDDVFPIKYIHNCIIVSGGTHIMILNKYKWFNENLPSIILNNTFDKNVLKL